MIDRSGSMDGEKMLQARDAALFILRNLRPEDRFGVIALDDEILDLTSGLVPATPANGRSALRATGALFARGGTNIHDAPLKAMGWLTPADRPQYVHFLTDGLPTAGVRTTDAIVQAATAANRARARLFAFGVGYDVNTHSSTSPPRGTPARRRRWRPGRTSRLPCRASTGRSPSRPWPTRGSG